MLLHLNIQNLAIVEKLDIEFKSGMTVITGETGAGKSILIDALELVLGARANSHLIREGAESAEVTASFDLAHLSKAKTWLKEQSLPEEDVCIIRRIMTSDGRNRCFINTTPTTLQALKQLGETMISIHGQHENQTLLKTEHQRQILDAYAKHENLLNTVETTYRAWQQEVDVLEKLQSQTQDASRIAFLNFQLDELKHLDLQKGEYSEIDAQLSEQQHASDIAFHRQQALNLLSEDAETNIQERLTTALQSTRALEKYNSKKTNLSKMLEEALIQIDEAIRELTSDSDKLENDPEQLAALEKRMSTIHDLARKHHVEPEALIPLREQLETELSDLEHREQRLLTLKKSIQEAHQQYQTQAKALTESRKKAAKKLNRLITERIHLLGMPNGSFEILTQTTEPSTLGNDAINFLVNTNPGMPLQPLNKTASGGELSRISLAIQVITAEQHLTPVLVFDEVDVGIGGATADIIGEQLALLSKTHQVFCITHLGQVAIHAKQHLQVSKEVRQKKTYSQVLVLDSKARVQEIARMISGKTATKQILSHVEAALKAVEVM